ncbi:DJ-1/PfpI family protein [Streptomyces flavofungini]|uniref:DJ-1/PfpI family protein n=1 Tax=Streptomyces flavofungini TaxID=68200 RepID=A0ABS0X0L3_9ACTN|nr:DJ-1/PfpI family protein [Streptomyces flavofungini]MBJ3806690.1 DJ-1/PfpI family protein [Streptomyces flavofungini]GHC61203.1 glutamine amidotransferase [Streptomyces flavofungini]
MTHPTTRRTLLRGTAAAATAALATTALTPTAHADTAPYPANRSTDPGTPPTGPRIGILLYDGYSLLDPTGPAEVLSRVPGASVTMLAERRGPVRTDTGDVAVLAERTLDEAGRLDVLLVPGAGNRGTIAAMENQPLLEWIRHTNRRTRFTTSVCTGSLVLAAAGLLDGRRATTYWASAPYLEKTFDITYVPERYVRSGKFITSAGVSAGLDMALYLAARLTDDDTARAIQLAVEYDPRPPFDAGDAQQASAELKARALKILADSQV